MSILYPNKYNFKEGRKIAWGVVPTLNEDLLEKADLNKMINNFKCADCFFQDKCVAFKKLNAFSAEARTFFTFSISCSV